MYQISRQLADEDTGIPSIMHGQTGVTALVELSDYLC